MQYKFHNKDEYLSWCQHMMQQIALASHMGDTDRVINFALEADLVITCPEGWELWKDNTDDLTFDEFIERHQDW